MTYAIYKLKSGWIIWMQHEERKTRKLATRMCVCDTDHWPVDDQIELIDELIADAEFHCLPIEWQDVVTRPRHHVRLTNEFVVMLREPIETTNHRLILTPPGCPLLSPFTNIPI